MPDYVIPILILLAVCLVVAILMRVTRVIITLVALLIIVPILCTVLWGDGTDYVSKFASIFTPQIEQDINDGYQIYKEENANHPVVDMDQVNEYVEQSKNVVSDWIDSKIKSEEDENLVFPSD